VRNASGEWRCLRRRETVFSRHPDGSPHLILCAADDITRDRPIEESHAPSAPVEFEQQRLARLLELNEKERRMVAYDVHDGFVQDVLGAQLAIDNMLDRLAVTDPESVPSLLRVRAFVRRAIDEARRVVSELRPAPTEDGGLVEAIQFLVNEADAAQLRVKFSFPKRFIQLSPLLVRALTRIVQEALTNVRRHAHTPDASVELTHRDDRIRLEISDRGSGFDVTSVPAGHFGLEGMKERARVFGGRTTIESRIGVGTRVIVEIPLDSPPVEAEEYPSPGARRPSVKKRRR
jgi:signal transduction histidine kinase